MATYLIDANLPYRLALWQGSAFLHVYSINDRWTDTEIWEYAQAHGLTIVTKDADFSDRIVISEPPPRVIHLRIGNMKIRDLEAFVERTWSRLCLLSESHKLVQVYFDHIGCVG